jgi:ubiquinone/menaquinone biosynthesis C-methylase UbiE
MGHWTESMREFSQTASHEAVLAFYRNALRDLGEGLTLLDLGAGSGTVATALLEDANVSRVVAYDRSVDDMSAIPDQEMLPKESSGTHTDLPFDDGRFDAVICRYAFHHFSDKPQALTEVSRVLCSGGLLLYSDPVFPKRSKLALNPLYRVREDHFDSFLTYHDTIRLLEEVGFEVLLMRPYKYVYDGFEKYLRGAEDGFVESGEHLNEVGSAADALKVKIRRAWLGLDEQIKEEMRFSETDGQVSFEYPLIDLAATVPA